MEDVSFQKGGEYVLIGYHVPKFLTQVQPLT